MERKQNLPQNKIKTKFCPGCRWEIALIDWETHTKMYGCFCYKCQNMKSGVSPEDHDRDCHPVPATRRADDIEYDLEEIDNSQNKDTFQRKNETERSSKRSKRSQFLNLSKNSQISRKKEESKQQVNLQSVRSSQKKETKIQESLSNSLIFEPSISSQVLSINTFSTVQTISPVESTSSNETVESFRTIYPIYSNEVSAPRVQDTLAIVQIIENSVINSQSSSISSDVSSNSALSNGNPQIVNHLQQNSNYQTQIAISLSTSQQSSQLSTQQQSSSLSETYSYENIVIISNLFTYIDPTNNLNRIFLQTQQLSSLIQSVLFLRFVVNTIRSIRQGQHIEIPDPSYQRFVPMIHSYLIEGIAEGELAALVRSLSLQTDVMSEEEIEMIPIRVVEENEENECYVCLQIFLKREVLRVLKGCNHNFHCKCVDKWLKKKGACPTCKMKQKEGARDRDRDRERG